MANRRPRVFIVSRSRAARADLRAILEDGGVEVLGEADTVHQLPPDAAESDVVTNLDEHARAPASASRGDAALVEHLTPRERQVIELAARGLSNRAIAARLNISDHTVKFHLSTIYGKLGVATRAEAVVQAVRNGVITI